MEVLSSRGVCLECAATDGTAAPTPPTDRPVPSDSLLSTAAVGPDAPPDAPTASFGVAARTDEPKPEPRPLPQAPAGYEILEPLGHGGMGDVYLAREQASERLVALKFLLNPSSPDAYDRFLVELRVLTKLDHPNIVRVLSHDFLRAQPYFTMEYLPGGSLSRSRDGAKALPIAETVRLIRTAAAAIAAAHAAGTIHRDLKPSNILLDAAGAPKVADFGLAKRLDENDGLTATTGMLGTPAFMPPEQVSRRNGPIGTWSDVYGLGATLYALLTDRPPFCGPTHVEVINQVLADPPPRPRAVRPEIPLGLEAIVLKCLAKETTDRYQTVAELLADLDRYEAGQRPVAPLMTPTRRLKEWATWNRHRLAVTATAMILLAGAFALGAAYWPPKEAPKVDPLVALEKELDAGGEVNLLGADGRPRRPRWVIDEAQVTASETRDGTIALQTHGLAFLELLSDPRRDRYRVTAHLRHLHANPHGGCVGMYVGGTSVAAPDGGEIYPAVLAQFWESYSLEEFRNPLAKAAHGVRLITATAHAPVGHMASLESASICWTMKFVPRDNAMPPWRVVTFDVTPEGVALFWSAEGDPPQLVGRISPKEIADERRRDPVLLAGGASPGPEWAPRRPLGIWLDDSAVSIKNVTIRSLPPIDGGPKP
ncbi:serine/threonine-protein kinase [Frigoriglobus tundricola]|uniref:Protein kinase domain-containing protein n=1 Tax=Frigoriglobus tundricola TaxID=2774151 RepID=A0A6M5YUC8_9BACT|nr:serine/threonine-protein kinase [Frigoriglobus tundricola]QJW96980.1 hypothetical protein FTUN_4540 [Frigoriglobus tundricola]